MFDFIVPKSLGISRGPVTGLGITRGGKTFFWIAKRFIDVVLCLLLLPVLVSFSLLLLLINPFVNRGSLFYVQKRMGRNCIPFSAIKFRSMAPCSGVARGPEDPIEHHRISAFARLLRKSRIDELPQILNVLNGEMSLIGPRPDYYDHAVVYLDIVPGYANRFAIRPGISGLAQVTVGYVSDSDGTCRKVAADISYIENASFTLESKIIVRTIWTIVSFRGS